MSIPSPKPQTWREKLTTPALFVGAWLLLQGCSYLGHQWGEWSDKRALARRQQRAAPYLKAADPFRRRVGLVPIAPALKPYPYPINHDGPTDGTELVLYTLARPPARCQWLEQKVLTIDSDNGQLLSERDEFRYTNPNTSDVDTAKYKYLTCEYSFARAKAGREPWKIWLATDTWHLQDGPTVYPGDSTYTRPQADSVLAAWCARGRRDSLAAVAQGPKKQ